MTTPLKIVIVGPFGMRPRGTMSVRALPLARALVERGHTVTMLLPPWQNPEDAGKCWDDQGVRIENLPLPAGLPGWFHGRLTLHMVRRALQLKPDVIHTFKPKAYAGLTHWLLARLPAGRRPRIVVDTDDWEGPGGWNDLSPYPSPLKAFFTWQERWGSTHADAVTVASRALETLTWALGVPPARVHYLPNGVAWQGPAVTLAHHPRPTLLLYTRFFEYDLERLWRIVLNVRARRPAVRLHVIGKGLFGEEKRLLEMARAADWNVVEGSANQQADLLYTGWAEPAALPALFAGADLALYPFDDTLINRTKCSVKLLDLLAAGLPVVGEAVGQLTESVISGETGLLVPSGDEAAFTAAILSLLDDPARRLSMGVHAARDIRTRLSWNDLVFTTEAAYSK